MDHRSANNHQPLSNKELHPCYGMLAHLAGVANRPSRTIHVVEVVLDPVLVAQKILEVAPPLDDDLSEFGKVDEVQERLTAGAVPTRLLIVTPTRLSFLANRLRHGLLPPRLGR